MGTVKYSGPVASFHCPTEATIRSLKVHFSPKQLGEGTPSPENVREIVGWTGVEVNKSGRNIIHLVGYSAVNLSSITATRKLTNGNGTTINTIDPEKSVTITQTLWPAAIKSSYQNGYFVVMDDNLKFEERYDISFRVTNIVNNPLNVTLSDFAIYNPRGTSVGNTKIIDGDRITFKNAIYNQNTATPLRHGFDVRICGMSCTISDFVVTAVDTEDRTYEPYHGETVDYEFGVLGKNKFPLSTSTTIENIKTGYNNTIARDVTSISIYQNVSANNYWIGSTTRSYISSVGSGEITFSSSDGSYGAGMFVPVTPNQAYVISGNSEKVRFRVGYYNDDGTFSGQHFIANKAFTVPAEYHYAFIVVVPQTDYYNQEITVSNIQLELGSTATTYEPYDPNKTVYGGWVDLVSGEVCDNWWKNTFEITADEGTVQTSGLRRIAKNLPSAHLCDTDQRTKSVCSQLLYLSQSNDSRPNFSLSKNTAYMYIPNDNTAYTFEIFYPSLTINATYQIAPTTMQTFLSHNNIWSNADYVEVEYDLHETQDILARKQFIIANQPHIESASGTIANFSTDMKVLLKNCKVHFNPVQEGEGTPSPENVRPITGRTGCKVHQTGKNLVDDSILQTATYNKWGWVNHLLPNTTYTWSAFGTSDFRYGLQLGAQYVAAPQPNKRLAYYISTGDSREFTTPDDMSEYPYLYVAGNSSGAGLVNDLNFQLELGSTATAYEPYNGTTLTIDWTTEAGTVYGGYVNLVTGEVWKTYNKIILDGDNIQVNNGNYESNGNYGAGLVYVEPIGKSARYKNGLPLNLWSENIPLYIGVNTLPEPPYVYAPLAGRLYFVVYVAKVADHPELADKTARKNYVNEWLKQNPITLVYELETPTIVATLSPSQLKTLRGTNNIWSNANGNIELSYWKH